MFTLKNVVDAIRQLKNNLSAVVDEIPPLFYKQMLSVLSIHLSIMPMSVCAVPEMWKAATVVAATVFKDAMATIVVKHF